MYLVMKLLLNFVKIVSLFANYQLHNKEADFSGNAYTASPHPEKC